MFEERQEMRVRSRFPRGGHTRLVGLMKEYRRLPDGEASHPMR